MGGSRPDNNIGPVPIELNLGDPDGNIEIVVGYWWPRDGQLF
jgi:hypothetical protein